MGAFEGVLVSDFFTAYDSLNCPQQKCLIHLMRDINDDLRKDPYNQEMRSIAEPFGRLLKEIVLAIDRFGYVGGACTNMSSQQKTYARQLRNVSLLLPREKNIKVGSTNIERNFSRF